MIPGAPSSETGRDTGRNGIQTILETVVEPELYLRILRGLEMTDFRCDYKVDRCEEVGEESAATLSTFVDRV